MKKTIYTISCILALLALALPLVAQNKVKKEVAIQLYSVRERIGSFNTKTDNYSTDYTIILKELAQLGYTAIEAAGYTDRHFYGRTPQQFKKDVENSGLKVLSSHLNKPLSEDELRSGDYSESLAWWDNCIADHKAAGMTYIVMPWLSVPKTVKDLDTYCKYFDEVGKKCRASGMYFGYHNHTQEFEKVEGKVTMFDYMIENTDPKYVFFEMDVYWMVMARQSPVDYFKKYPDRFKVLHIKDQREIGQSGMVGFDAIFNYTDIAGVNHIVVEMEGHTNGLENGLKTSIDYLLNAPFVKKSYVR